MQANNWTETFEDLPKYGAGGKEVLYTVVEAPVVGYTASYKVTKASGGTETGNTLNGGSVEITNKHEPKKTTPPTTPPTHRPHRQRRLTDYTDNTDEADRTGDTCETDHACIFRSSVVQQRFQRRRRIECGEQTFRWRRRRNLQTCTDSSGQDR